MKTITELVKIGMGQRYKLYLDDELFGIYEAEILARHCLKSGQSFEDSFFEELKFENGDYACFNRSLKVLEKSMKTEKMMRDYLKEKDYPISCIDKAIDKLKEYGYISDENFCESYIASNSYCKSKRKIKYDLLNKGVDKDLIESKLSLLDDEEEFEKCLKAAQKYMKNREFDLKTKQKLYSHLAGKGYEFGQIASVWDKIKEGDDE